MGYFACGFDEDELIEFVLFNGVRLNFRNVRSVRNGTFYYLVEYEERKDNKLYRLRHVEICKLFVIYKNFHF